MAETHKEQVARVERMADEILVHPDFVCRDMDDCAAIHTVLVDRAELLEALKHLEEYGGCFCDYHSSQHSDYPSKEHSDECVRATTAIAKATEGE